MATCPHRERLIIEWRESVSTFSDQVKRLSKCSAGNGDGFLKQFHVTDLARKNCEDIHTALSLHRKEHGC